MVDENRIEGAARDFGGKVQDAVGGLIGDADTQARGKANQAAGQVQNAYGQAADQVRDVGEHLGGMVKDQPLAALGIATGIGVLIGLLIKR
jgi:uncharacterized protein YjbJ (UPF0337 family)